MKKMSPAKVPEPRTSIRIVREADRWRLLLAGGGELELLDSGALLETWKDKSGRRHRRGVAPQLRSGPELRAQDPRERLEEARQFLLRRPGRRHGRRRAVRA